ncbi:hypothetical protein AYJ57_20825 (plasmid) [Salipiger sp. CCB-MM3]|uniref:3'-5' exonuclease n=1 Tax=Salipiger sp. CCB-MM3 TaxID=1792508 RepID=UPI00080AB00E|nr:exonuclease domain-containing protein [Salipiger sp. CCB-MM3]ANT62925.1 hypothetical protein AYJ57_20825 [Salipiger sp. CCB-MM3]
MSASTAEVVLNNPAYFLDLEASSLMPGSWPIEIGVASVKDGVVVSDARLIQPHTSWSDDLWSAESEAVHGITLEELEKTGSSIEEVLAWYDTVNIGVAVSDNPEFDARWLGCLARLTRTPPRVRLVDFDTYVMMTLKDTAAVNKVFRHLEQCAVPHRAGEDARRMAEAWLVGAASES